MQVTLDNEKITRAITDAATDAVVEALKGWEVAKAIGEVITKEVAEGIMAEALRRAIRQIDNERLITTLAVELEKGVVRAVTHILEEGVLDVVCKLRGISDYSDEGKKERERLKHQLFARDDERREMK